jgi:hypothetical protein
MPAASTIEQAIYEKMTGSTTITTGVTTYGSAPAKPAIFEAFAPHDSMTGWNGDQYPRVIYSVFKNRLEERQQRTVLQINTEAKVSTSDGIDVLGRNLKNLFDAAFLVTTDGTWAAAWENSEPYDNGAPIDALVLGYGLQFELYLFPAHVTAEPDPVKALTDWVKATISTAETDPTLWSASKAAVYFREKSIGASAGGNSRWNLVRQIIAGHVLGTPAQKTPVVKAICEKLAAEQRLELGNNGTLRILRISADTARNYLRDGQIDIEVEYISEAPVTQGTPLTQAIFHGVVPDYPQPEAPETPEEPEE